MSSLNRPSTLDSLFGSSDLTVDSKNQYEFFHVKSMWRAESSNTGHEERDSERGIVCRMNFVLIEELRERDGGETQQT